MTHSKNLPLFQGSAGAARTAIWRCTLAFSFFWKTVRSATNQFKPGNAGGIMRSLTSSCLRCTAIGLPVKITRSATQR